MEIRCTVCGEYFHPNDETIELISEGWITADSINTCDECFEMIKNPFYDDLSEMISDADPGL
jgi:hypothetical protein